MKKAVLFAVLFILEFAGCYNCTYCNNVFSPSEINISNISSNFQTIPKSKIIRVGIGSQNFSSYLWNNVAIYGTGQYRIFNNKTYIGTYKSDNEINIQMIGKIFVLTDKNNNTIAKVSGPVIFKPDFGYIGIKGLKRAGKDAVYRGDLELICPKENLFHIVNSLEVEDYLTGVVPNEMPVHFGLEALKAQSVAARNYVLSPRVKANSNYDVVDSVASQVYFGANTEKDLATRAVEETKGIVAIYNWDLILALYSSTAGGYTESYENAFSDPKTKAFPATSKPYLIAKPDYETYGILNTDEDAENFYTTRPKSFDEKSSYFRWEREWTQEELQKEIQDHIAAQSTTGFVHPAVAKGVVLGKIKKLKVLKRGFSGKIMLIEIQTETGNYLIQKELVIRRLFTVKGKALPSANFVIKQEFDKNENLISVKIYGAGYGHGVGLSQYGAGYMGTCLNKTFQEILQHYYSGISLGTEPFTLSASSGQNNITQTFYSKDAKATLVIDNKYELDYVETNINGFYEALKLDKKERYNRINLADYLQKGTNTITFTYPKTMEINKGLKMYIELAGKNEYAE